MVNTTRSTGDCILDTDAKSKMIFLVRLTSLGSWITGGQDLIRDRLKKKMNKKRMKKKKKKKKTENFGLHTE